MYSNPCAHRVRAFVGSSNRTVYSRISICTHGSIHICHRPGYGTPRIHSPSFPPFYRSTRFSLSWKNYYATTVVGSRPIIVPRRIIRNHLILTRRLDHFLVRASPCYYTHCNRLDGKMLENICTNISEYQSTVRERRFKVAASGRED